MNDMNDRNAPLSGNKGRFQNDPMRRLEPNSLAWKRKAENRILILLRAFPGPAFPRKVMRSYERRTLTPRPKSGTVVVF